MPSDLDGRQGQVVGFIDIGTNSLRLLLVDILPNHSYRVLSAQKETVRLGEDEFLQDRLQPEAMSRAALVCRNFAEMARARGAREIVAVATSATRDAANQTTFLRRLKREAQIDVNVIPGREEARLIYLGVSSGIHLDDRQAIFIDIGGGSTELIVGTQNQYRRLESLSLGAIRLTLLFLVGETRPVPPSVYRVLQRHVRHAAVRAVQSLRRERIDLAIGSSGTIENLADIAARYLDKRKRRPDDVLTRERLRRVVEMLCELPLEERRQVPGINPERADIIIAGAAILETLMQDLELDEIQVSERGLREGLLVDYLARAGQGDLAQSMPVRERSVLQLGRACSFDETHARQTAHLALELFDSAREAGLHDRGQAEREVLQYAALLHDIGSFLSYDNHHVLSYHLIRNSDLLGFDRASVNRMAAVSLFHRKALPGKKRLEFAALDKRSQRIVLELSSFLRVAESLDRSHAGLVAHAGFREIDKKKAVLEIVCVRDAQLELWGVQAQAGTFAQVWKRKLVVETKSQPA